ncbi:hypothetical protein BN164_750007 [Clostridioides difficile T20]|nr:hypothetical protein BN164_750007 [Clostridioides difficile T20]
MVHMVVANVYSDVAYIATVVISRVEKHEVVSFCL